MDQEVVSDNGIVTSRKQGDIPAFNKKMIWEFRAGADARQPVGAGRRVDGI